LVSASFNYRESIARTADVPSQVHAGLGEKRDASGVESLPVRIREVAGRDEMDGEEDMLVRSGRFCFLDPYIVDTPAWIKRRWRVKRDVLLLTRLLLVSFDDAELGWLLGVLHDEPGEGLLVLGVDSRSLLEESTAVVPMKGEKGEGYDEQLPAAMATKAKAVRKTRHERKLLGVLGRGGLHVDDDSVNYGRGSSEGGEDELEVRGSSKEGRPRPAAAWELELDLDG
jgi:hypothetical protein